MSLGAKIVSGAGWMVGFKLVERGLGLVSTIVLARVLSPDDFGLVAMATAVTGIIELIGALGFDVALIQKQSPDRRYYDTTWTLNLLTMSACALIISLLAQPSATFYGEPRLAPVMYCLAASTALGALANVGIVDFRKNFQFHKEFAFLFARKLASVAVAIIVALALQTYWALVAGIVTARVISVFLSYAMHSFRPRLSLAAARELIRFGGWLLANSILLTLSQRLSDFVVGKLSGTGALGVFSVGYELSTLPSSELIAPINRAVLPGYSRLNQDLASLRDGFLRVFGVIALVVIPAGVGIAVIAEPLVLTVLGDKWRDAIPLLQILPMFGVLWGLQTNVVMVALALGKPRLVTMNLAAFLVLLLPSIILGLNEFGIRGLAWAHVFVGAITLPMMMFTVCRMLSLQARSLLTNVWRPALSAAVMYAAIGYLDSAMRATDVGAMARVVVEIVVGALVFSGCVLALWAVVKKPVGAEQFLFAQFRVHASQRRER